MSLTLNQVITRLESLAGSHKQINTVFTGAISEFMSADRVYPCCFIEQQKQFSISKADKQVYYTFRFHFLDLMDVSANATENEFEIKSDMAYVAIDYMAMLEYNDYLQGEDSWSIQFNTGEIVDYKLHDVAAGAMIEVRVGVRYLSDRCQVPSGTVTFETDRSMKIINNYIHKVSAEASTLTITALINKEMVLMMIGDKPGEPVTDEDAILTANEYRYTAGTGLFEFGTLLQPEQVLQILNRNI